MFSLLNLFNKKIGFPNRLNYLTKELTPFLKGFKKVLDLGPSSGILAYQISKKLPKTSFVGVDTHLQPKRYIKVIKYDGKKIPFPDNSFDCVMIIDMLHHDTRHEEVIREAKRVSKKYILIKDHYYENYLDFLVLKIADYIGNKPYNVNLPYAFLKLSEWDRIIKKLKLKTVKTDKFQYSFFHPAKHVVYLLKK
jgi:ubiquinone/menaquinone biosynthesis C-methylase UbiE